MWTPELNSNEGTKYEQIAAAIASDIAKGRLKPGERLPPQRKLASVLGVTIGTVGRAYALAERKGLTRSQVGSGCYVTQHREPSSQSDAVKLTIDLSSNFPPDVRTDQIFSKTLVELSNQKNLSRLFAAIPVDAYRHQREAAANWLSSRIECDQDAVLICAGTQSASIASLSALTKPGDSVLVESHTFPGILSALELLRLKPIPIPMDASGILPSEIDVRNANVIFLNPTNQNPTASSLNLSRRRKVIALIKKHNLWLLEDDTYGKLIQDAPPTISSLVPDRSILITSLSKSMSVGLRLAFLVAPKPIREQVLAKLEATSFFPTTLSVEIATNWIVQGIANELVASRRKIAERRIRLASEILPNNLIAGKPLLNHLWLHLPESWTAKSFCRAAYENGVILSPASIFAANSQVKTNTIRIALGAARNDEELTVALRKLSRLLSDKLASSNARF